MTGRWPLSHRRTIGALAAATLLLAVFSVAVGETRLDIVAAAGDVMRGRETLAALVLVELRLPRALLGAVTGFGLGLAGAAMQGLLRNPLAEPGVMGVSGAAALGAVIVFYAGLSAALPFALPLGGMAGAAAASAVLFALAGRGLGTTTLVLAGVAINALAGALTSLVLNLSPNPYAVTEIVFWLMGSLADRSLADIGLMLAPTLAGWWLLLGCGRGLDALSLGEDVAQSLGFDLPRLRARLVLGTALAVGSAVAVTGMIGFVGLVAPHLARPLAGREPGRLLPAAGLVGALLTLAADIALRLLPLRPELNLGVVTALVGAPFLLVLLRRLRGAA
ncbi:MAG: FecCD family ABC transporter permease [Pseudochelatococcus sp.]|jgi:iron complex transport system permease protein|uniref:FecCD family ABC transporter permease n=1 Tax=Pseudochelatococcus sp. TaxID=2020869 RepID=UPI003D916502